MNSRLNAAALPDVSELLADVADDAERLAVAGQLLAVAGWLADFGASMAGEPGHAGNPLDWFMRPTTRAAVDALGVKVRA